MTLTTAFMPALDDGLVTSEDPVDPAVRPQRRRFTAAFKVEVLAAYDAATGPGEKGALLRKHGLYSSHLVEWRKAQQAGALAGLNGLPGRRRRRPSSSSSRSSGASTDASNAS